MFDNDGRFKKMIIHNGDVEIDRLNCTSLKKEYCDTLFSIEYSKS